MRKQNEEIKVAVYCRYSKDDGKAADSSSIESQREMLTKYVREQGWRLHDTYVEMKTTRLIQFNYSYCNFIFGCISWVHKFVTADRKMHPNAPKCTQCTRHLPPRT